MGSRDRGRVRERDWDRERIAETGGWGLGSRDWGMGNRDWGLETGDSGLETRDWGLETGDSRIGSRQRLFLQGGCFLTYFL